MTRTVSVLLMVIAIFAIACSSDRQQQLEPRPPSAPPPNPVPGTSSLYLGPFTGGFTGVGKVKVDFRGCDGLIVVETSVCIDLLVDGEYETVDRLGLGSIVEFDSNPSKGNARVDKQHAAIGQVEAVDRLHSQFTVLGQTVYMSDVTAEFGSNAEGGITNLDDLAAGDDVMVSGYFSNNGEIVATLVQRSDSPRQPLLRGTLAQEPGGQFRVGDLQLDLGGAILYGFPGGAPLAGDPVLVRAEQPPQAGMLAVTTLRHAGREARASSEDNLTGFVTFVRANDDFDVEGIGFRSSGCHQCNMLEMYGKQLSAGMFVQLYRSTIDVATLSRSWATGNTTELAGPIEAIDAQSGSVIVHGFRAQATPVTEITADLEPWIGSDMLDLAEFSVGDHVSLSGGVLGEVLVADRMSPTASGARIRTRTFELADPAISFLGRSIQTNESTVVLDCGYFDDICEVADIAWLFGHTEDPPFMLVMEIENVGSELRAKRIEALSL